MQFISAILYLDAYFHCICEPENGGIHLTHLQFGGSFLRNCTGSIEHSLPHQAWLARNHPGFDVSTPSWRAFCSQFPFCRCLLFLDVSFCLPCRPRVMLFVCVYLSCKFVYKYTCRTVERLNRFFCPLAFLLSSLTGKNSPRRPTRHVLSSQVIFGQRSEDVRLWPMKISIDLVEPCFDETV